MSLVFKRVKTYSKLALLVGLAVVALLVIVYNRSNTVDFWFFGRYEQINVLWLVGCTAVGSVASWWIVSASIGVGRDLAELKRSRELQATRNDQESLAKQLAETEKRIDRKLKTAVGEKPED